MKTIIISFTLMLVMILAGNQNSYAQAAVTMQLVGIPQDCNCPLPGNAYWKFYCAVIDECGQEYAIVYEDYQMENATTTSSVFQLDEFCKGFTDDCYLLIAGVTKLCPDGLGGFVETCKGKNPGEFKTCQELMGDQVGITISQWEP